MPASQLFGLHSERTKRSTHARKGSRGARLACLSAGYEHPSSDLSVLKFPNILCGSGEHQSMQARPEGTLGITWSWLAEMRNGSWQVLGALVMVVVCLFCAYCRFGRVRRSEDASATRVIETHRSHSKKDLSYREQHPEKSCVCVHCY